MYQGGATWTTGQKINGNFFLPGQNYPSCLDNILSDAARRCKNWFESDRHKNFSSNYSFPSSYDDCMIWDLAGGNPDFGRLSGYPRTLNWSPKVGGCETWETCQVAPVVLDLNCNWIPNADPTAGCQAGLFQWIASPISLLWEENADINTDIRFTQFPLDPKKVAAWHVSEWFVY